LTSLGIATFFEVSLTIGCPLALQIVLDRWCPMEYKRSCADGGETPTYLALPNKLFSAEERADIVALVAG